MPEVQVSNLYKQFGTTTVLKEVSFTIKDGEFFTLLGPSGCGKSTTLNCIAGLERPTGGTITVGGTAFVDSTKKVFLVPEERNLGMVFQSYALWPHMTLEGNLAVPLKIRKVGKDEQTTRISEALDKVGLAHLKDRYPHQLSGGQQQRVAPGPCPGVLPVGAAARRAAVQPRRQIARAGQSLAQAPAGRPGHHHRLRHPRPGRGAGPVRPDRGDVRGQHDADRHPTGDYETPAAAEVAAFVGRCNFLRGTVVEQRTGGRTSVRLECSGDVVDVESAQPVTTGQDVTLAIRPERLEVLPVDRQVQGVNALATEVLTTSYVGARYEYDLKLGNHVVQVESSRPGLTGAVLLTFAPDEALLYPQAVVPSAEAEELLTISS